MANNPEDNKPIHDQKLYLAFQLMNQKDYTGAQTCLEEGLEEAKNNNDENLEGLYLSTLGVLYKLKKDYKKAYKFYQQAEKLLKDDHSLKIISAHLLIEQFKQYETAVRKLQKVIQESKDPAILHHSLAAQAIAYYQLNQKDNAKENFEIMLTQDFETLRFAANLDFKMVEFFVKKNFQLDWCADYLKKALDLAKSKNEKVFIAVIEQLTKLLEMSHS